MVQSVDKALRKAHMHVARGQLAEAEAVYNEILARYPKNKRAILGRAKLKAGITSKIVR